MRKWLAKDPARAWSARLAAASLGIILLLTGASHLGGQTSCGLMDLGTGQRSLSETVTATYVFSDCEGMRQVELVVVWRGGQPGWFNASVSDPDEFRRYQPGGDLDESAEQWKSDVITSIRPEPGIIQASAFDGFLWGMVHYPDAGRWYLVNGFEPPSFDVLGHVDVQIGDGSQSLVFVDDTDGDAHVVEVLSLPARDASRLALTSAELRAAREEGRVPVVPDPRELLEEIIKSTERGADFLSGAGTTSAPLGSHPGPFPL